EYLKRIRSGAHRLDQLIQDVLTYSRVSGGELNLERIDLHKLVTEIVSEYPGFREAVTIDAPLHPVRGNHAFVTQCLSNLIGNAVKFVRPGERPRVRIKSEASNGMVRLWIEDNGIGIDPQYHGKIFGVFERIHPGQLYEGTGIGLAIVRKAVERMGGRVGLESSAGKGSRFWIELPSCGE
ncbi:MAG: sensor histidine kinase, partial [Limisphaerales bacterium]